MRLLVDVPQLRELDHAVDAVLDLVLREADELELLPRVLARAQERAQPGGQLDQRVDRATPLDVPGRRSGDAGCDAQERALAGAVPPDQADHLAALELERDVVERDDVLAVVRAHEVERRAEDRIDLSHVLEHEHGGIGHGRTSASRGGIPKPRKIESNISPTASSE